MPDPGSFGTVFLKFIFLLTPFAAISTFLALAPPGAKERRRIALRATAAVVVACLVFYFFGRYLFDLLGITVDAFRIGAGAILFLSGVAMTRGIPKSSPSLAGTDDDSDIAVVPIAIPVTVGPGTTGALLVMASEPATAAERAVTLAALFAACVAVGAGLLLADPLLRVLGPRGINVLTKLTGLFLAALAAEIVFTGVRNFLAAG